MKKGDIVLVPFPFTDFSGQKTRPALLLSVKEFDVIAAFITTKFKWQEKYDIALSATKENGLKQESLIKLGKIATIDKAIILGELGKITSEEISSVNTNLKKLLVLD